jgi:acyl-CoA synthetase (AMP-forming)/AMP-acid ligase II
MPGLLELGTILIGKGPAKPLKPTLARPGGIRTIEREDAWHVPPCSPRSKRQGQNLAFRRCSYASSMPPRSKRTIFPHGVSFRLAALPFPRSRITRCSARRSARRRLRPGLISPTRRQATRILSIDAVGRALPQTEIKIVNPETGALLPRGEIGEMCARSYGVMKDYFDNPEETAAAIDADPRGEAFVRSWR